jgi:hypothetical protein
MAAICIVASPVAFAENPSSDACTVDRYATPPPPFESKLGDGVDKLSYVTTGMYGNMTSLIRDGWSFSRDPAGSSTDRSAKEIHVQGVASDLTTTSLLTHEVGHALFNPKFDYSSKEAFVRVACQDEGYALLKNIQIRNSIKMCDGHRGGGVDIGISAAQPWAPYEDYMAEHMPMNMYDFGMMFCEANIASGGKSYLQYYGDWYDQSFGSKAIASMQAQESSLPKATPVFWDKLQKIAKATTGGAEALAEVWPAKGMRFRDASGRAVALSVKGGSQPLDSVAMVSESALATDEFMTVKHARLSISGACITRQDIEQHYPDLVLTDIPRPGNRVASMTWSAFGSWGKIGFAFEGAQQRCLSNVFFDPNPRIPQSNPHFDPSSEE